MISLRKLDTLSDGTRRRKIPIILREIERILLDGDSVDRIYLKGLMAIIIRDRFWAAEVRETAQDLGEKSSDELLRAVNELKHGTLWGLGRNWADWDAESRPDDKGVSGRSVFPYRVYLDGLRSPFNVGSVFRTCLAFGFEQVWASPDCAPPDHARSVRSSMGAVDMVPWRRRDIKDVAKMELGHVFSLEVGGTPIDEFRFPESGTVVLGSEELGVSPDVMRGAESDGGVVSIPLPGPKTSLNVGVAFGILAHYWSIQRNSRCLSNGEGFFQSPAY